MDSKISSVNSEVLEKFYNGSVSLLSKGTVQMLALPLTNIEKQIHELTEKQQILAEQLHNENLKLAWNLNSSELQEIYILMRLYDTKLINLKRNMKLLHEKIIKLKKRAIRLQQFQEKQSYIKSQQRGQE